MTGIVIPAGLVIGESAVSAAAAQVALRAFGLATVTLTFTGSTNQERRDISYVVYTKTHPSGQVYVGRTSGSGTPEQVLRRRDASHPYNAEGYGPAVIFNPPLTTSNPQAGHALRGREQQVLDFYGGVGNPMVGNRIRAVSRYNPRAYSYWLTSNMYFGPLMPY